jgi:hypothetical protein
MANKLFQLVLVVVVILATLFTFHLIMENNCTVTNSRSARFENLRNIKISKDKNLTKTEHSDITHTSELIDFEGFDNENGANQSIVPNIVHLIYLNTTEISFYKAINIYSIFLNHNPEQIFLHCDNCSFHGHYWEQIISIKELKNKLVINQIPFHDTIFGAKFGWLNHHRLVY